MTSPNLDRVLDAIFRVDMNFDVKFASEAGLYWLGGEAPASAPKNMLDILHPADVEHFMIATQGNPDSFACDIRMLKEGQPCWVNLRAYRLPVVNQYVMCVIDISSWKVDDSSLRHAAEHDDLTGLPNRTRLKRAVEANIRAEHRPFTVAMLDLDGFKRVNDTFGHALGDAVLVETAKRLMKVMGPNDLAVRLGGDEFVLLLNDKDAAAAKATMSSVLFAIARPYDAAPHNAYLGVSIGIAEYPTHGEDYSTLLKHADIAMYRAKNAGKNRVSVFFQTSENVDFSIKTAMHNGIEEGEFHMEYQPQYDMQRKLVGAEALMRWNSRNFGRVSPDQFIPIAEDAGLMPFLGKWALRYACHELRNFRELMPDFVMSVNVSPIQFDSDNFDTVVLDVIAETGVDPKRVILEITESTLMHSKEKTERALATLREKGVRFSIDDFGTGFSSLAYLTRLPVSGIKIDKSFIRAIEHQTAGTESDQKLVRAMIDLAHSIDLKVVAEGVENDAQFDFLANSGCNLIQGYLLGRPISAEAMRQLLRSCIEVAA